MISKSIRNILFDLDGTLIDSAPDIINCIEQVYFNVLDKKIILSPSIIGPPLKEIIDSITPTIKNKKKDILIKEFRLYYDKSGYPKTKLYPGILNLFNKIKGIGLNIFIITNKPSKSTKKILKKLGIIDYCKDIATPDTLMGINMDKNKMLNHIINKWDLDKNKSILISDSYDDIIIAQKNLLPSAIVLYGYNNNKNIYKPSSNPPVYFLKCVKEISDLLGV